MLDVYTPIIVRKHLDRSSPGMKFAVFALNFMKSIQAQTNVTSAGLESINSGFGTNR